MHYKSVTKQETIRIIIILLTFYSFIYFLNLILIFELLTVNSKYKYYQFLVNIDWLPKSLQ